MLYLLNKFGNWVRRNWSRLLFLIPWPLAVSRVRMTDSSLTVTLNNKLWITVTDGTSCDSLPIDLVSEECARALLEKAFPGIDFDKLRSSHE